MCVRYSYAPLLEFPIISQQSSWDVCLEISSSVYSFNTTSLSDFAMVTTNQKRASTDSFKDTHTHTDNWLATANSQSLQVAS
jgi:hypothetical protein